MRRKQDAVELKDEQEQETAVSVSLDGLSRAFPSTDDRTIWYCLDRPKPRLRGVLHKWCALSSPVWCCYQLSLCNVHNVLAVGLSVDYSAHVAHAFVVAKGTRQQRADAALAEMGTAVVHGFGGASK